MDSKGKLIYSYRFPSLARTEVKEGETMEFKWPERFPTAEAFLKYVQNSTVYIFSPRKQLDRRFYVELARKISVDYQIDMDITDYFSHIDVKIYTPYRSCWGDLKVMLGALVVLSDSIDLFPSEENSDEVVLTFRYKLYDR